MNQGHTQEPFFEQVDVFAVEGPDVHRIPSMVVSSQGTILAFCNRRIRTTADFGNDTNLVLRRSLDGGKTWEPTQTLFARQGWRAGIGNAVVDRMTGTIMIIYGRSLTDAEASEKAYTEGTRRPPPHPDAGTFILRSDDDGNTWLEEQLILRPNALGLEGRTHGGGPAIQLKYSPHVGRLVMPARTHTKPIYDLAVYPHNCVIYSDDGGATWTTSGLGQAGTGEACIVETVGGAICLNSRQYHKLERRGLAWSYDGGETFTNYSWDQNLTDPHRGGCNASMIRYSDSISGDRTRILFANPASRDRERMTVRVSYDECRTWPISKLLWKGPAAYSDLCIAPDMTICCLYERGREFPYETVTFARFNLEWLTDGRDSLGS